MNTELLDITTAADGANAVNAATAAPNDLLGRIGTLETRLTRSDAEIDAAQSIRYKVFVEEMHAQVAPEGARRKRDIDSWDVLCDHLVVVDRSIEGDQEEQIVGTYRLLRQEVAEAHGGFYSASEFSLDRLIASHPGKRFIELGRSCVLPEYRNKRTMELLWQGAWAYALRHRGDAMIGCASFPGVFPEEHALALSFLHNNAVADGEWAVEARPELYRQMDLMPAEAINARKAISSMPPLIKGYLRLGAMFGDGAVVDHAFNTTDVLIVLPISRISDRYLNYYGTDAGRFAS
ncbi:MAG TPA: GNAT family N-acetyltransferase [Rhizobium sp.]|nr:GNAT family N-acetyltransferase [Rhizobium sp.]